MTLSDKYGSELWAAQNSGVAAEPEAQLTVPVANLLTGLAVAHGLGTLTLLREAQLTGVRPDFAALIDGRPCGWVELKAPGHTLDGSRWVGRERSQWRLLSELDSLLVTDGQDARLYRQGEPVADATLPWQGGDSWDPKPLVDALRLFASSRPATITRASELAHRLASLAALLRDRIKAGLDPSTARTSIKNARAAWRASVHEGATDSEFANDLAQVISYSLAIAALRGGADANDDHYLSLSEARDSLRGPNDLLAATLGPVLGVPGLTDDLAPEIGAIERLASVVDAQKIAKSKDTRGEPWLWFYEDFLARYDPEARKEAGVYYTPTDVVKSQVRLVAHVLSEVFKKPLTYGDPGVVTLDPAAGSGTYPLAVLDHAAKVATEVRGVAGPQQVVKALSENVMAFELLPGPYAVSHLRIGQRLADLANSLLTPPHVRVYLTNTLDDPEGVVPVAGLWGDQETLARERQRAADVKRTQPVTVVLGNPPYARRTAESGGGWVLHNQRGRALFDDVLDAPKRAGVIFSAQASLYNDYAYFWRWALWKVFEQDKSKSGAISFISAASWLRGPAFVGLRSLARELADEIWVVDLGGEGRGARTEENVFSIQTPVAIVTMYRKGAGSKNPARVLYRRILGTANEKLQALTTLTAPVGAATEWIEVAASGGGVMVPETGDADWTAMPLLTDLMPYQQPGAMVNRAWPIAPSRDVLTERWRQLLAAQDADERAARFVTSKTGRNIHTQVSGLPPISTLASGAPSRPIVRYGFRAFDQQWIINDPRLIALERPELWDTLSDRQVFLTTFTTSPIGSGPALTVTTAVPDKHHFRGSYGGKDVFPLYLDRAGTRANVAPAALGLLKSTYGMAVTAEDLVAYIFAVMAQPAYHAQFAKELDTPGPRIPVTTDAQLFAELRDLGKYLLWIQTFGTRFAGDGRLRNSVPPVPGLEWVAAVSDLPATTDDISYDAAARRLQVGDGAVAGVSAEVWEFSVSGWPVIERWLGYRTKKGIGRSSQEKRMTPLDRVRPKVWEDEWNDELLHLLRVLTHTVEQQDRAAALLEQVLDGELLSFETGKQQDDQATTPDS